MFFSAVTPRLTHLQNSLYEMIHPTLSGNSLPAQLPQIPVNSSTTSSPLFSRRLADFKLVFDSKEMKAQLNDLLVKEFVQLDVTQFFTLMAEILSKNLSYEETYQELFNRIGEAKKGSTNAFFANLRSAKILKQKLAGQIGKLLGPHTTFTGYAEIGSPGRLIRPLKSQADITLQGPKIAIKEQEKFSDYLDVGFPLPYDRFVSLSNGDPISSQIDKSSLELVTCPSGLHHFPAEKVQEFVQSIHEVLKPEGTFILREHDIRNKDLESLANVVQSVFNAIIGVPLQAELKETRQYRNLNAWIKLIENSGFKLVGKSLKVDGDPTENALLCFRKIPKTLKETHLHELEKAIKETRTNYVRPREQTYMTTMEWHVATIAEEYAEFIKKEPIYKFPFFKQIQVLGKSFIDSCKDAIRASSFSTVATSEYMLMNFFIFISTSLGFLLRGLAYAPLAFKSRLSRDPDDFDPFSYLTKDAQEHAEFIKKAAPYEFPHFRKLWNLWKGYLKSSKKSLLSTYITTIATAEYVSKGLVSAPLAKLNRDLKREKIQLIVEDQKDRVNSLLDERIEVIKSDTKFKLKAIEIPGSLLFKDMVRKLIMINAKIAVIAGQKKIQVEVKVNNEAENLKDLKGCKKLSEIPIVTDSTHKYVRLEVEVTELDATIKALEAAGIELSHIHDF